MAKGKLIFEQCHLSAIRQNLEVFVAQLSVTGPKGRYPVRSQMEILALFLSSRSVRGVGLKTLEPSYSLCVKG